MTELPREIEPATETESMEELLQRLKPRLKRILAHYKIPLEDAEDVLQDALFTTFRKWDSIRYKEPWLLAALRNHCMLYWKRRRANPTCGMDAAALEAACQPLPPPQQREELVWDLEALANRVGPRHWAVLCLRYGLGLSNRDVAKRLGYCASSIRKISCRAVTRLRRGLAPGGLASPRETGGSPAALSSAVFPLGAGSKPAYLWGTGYSRGEGQSYRPDSQSLGKREHMRAQPNNNRAIRAVEELEPRQQESEHSGDAARILVRQGDDLARQKQNMDAMGRLAGGIAHVFNNLLTAIACETELALTKLPADDAARKHLREIEKAGERGATLARQLLAFSGRQVLHPKLLQLNSLLSNLDQELRRILGDAIELRMDLDPELDRVNVDPAQFRQAILNLASNARDVMPEGGRLTLQTKNLEIRPGTLNHPLRSAPGRYVLLEVSDTGPGMSDDIRRSAFEPFFTTKKGVEVTGLGLSTAYGIITQSGGHIVADSEQGNGTRFLIFLPSAEEAGNQATAESPSNRVTILLVEDEENVRKPLLQILEGRGYRVLEAADAAEAMDVSRRHQGPIHLMVTDILMAGMTGVELAESLSFTRPEMKVLFATGYPAGLAEGPSLTSEDMPLLKKPFSGKDLAAKVREVLEGPD